LTRLIATRYSGQHMKGEHLGELEELTLLAICASNGNAYGPFLRTLLSSVVGRATALGSIYSALNRLEAKGYAVSELSEPEPVRGGKKRRLFTVTREGRKQLRRLRTQRDSLWQLLQRRERPGALTTTQRASHRRDYNQ
jgi:PadR family transcriptional regulator, regulatory protein PadR